MLRRFVYGTGVVGMAAIVALALVALKVVGMSLPDLRRYLRMRQM